MSDKILIFPEALITAAETLKDPKSLGKILMALVGKSMQLNETEKYIVAAARREMDKRLAARKANAERKRNQRGKMKGTN